MLSKLIRTALAAGAAVALLACTASAARLSTSEQGFEVEWQNFFPQTELLIAAGGNSIVCEITFLGTLNRTIAKTVGVAMGRFTHATMGRCSEGTMIALEATMPWEILYREFSGTLPSYTSIGVSIPRFSLRFRNRAGTLECLISVSAMNPVIARFTTGFGGTIDQFRMEERTRIPLSGSAGCALLTGVYQGAALAINLASTRSLTISLI